ncbi:MAG: TM0996/MTH895 family glutaredoxin-like protein [Chloroflexia bacterium]|nr:TM0996/MTH895 family glutaredoxin-like protein [Chloroflexia bacterium]
MEIKILGTGCPKCKRLEQVTREALADMGVAATITKVTDMADIMAYEILITPGLVINEKVVVSGRLPSKAEVSSMIATALAEAEL